MTKRERELRKAWNVIKEVTLEEIIQLVFDEKFKKKQKEVEAEKNKEDASYILKMLGIPCNIQGYKYLQTAILLGKENHEYLEMVTKALYPAIAKKNGSTSGKVERAMRHAIETAWTRGDFELREKIFGRTVSAEKGKPTNSEFISCIVDYLYPNNL